MDNYYAVLGVDPAADFAAIKRAYRQQLKSLHPDINHHPSSHRQAASLNQAFATLSQPQLRQKYDRLLVGKKTEVAPSVSWKTHASIIGLWLITLSLLYWLQLLIKTAWSSTNG